jgi:uncharacterized protein (UPF0333 family)
MNQKGISALVIAVIVVIVVAAVGVGVYLAMSNTGENGGNGGGETPDVEGATSLQFSVAITAEGESIGTYTYMAKNIGTSDMMIRVEMSNGYELVDIVNGAEQKAWEYMAGEWTDLSDTFSDQWDAWDSTWQGYKNSLADWTGTGDWTYTDTDGSSIRVYDIAVNPSLADSLFQPS